MAKCFFCHLALGDKPELISEDDGFFAIYDAAPVSLGHAIVVPKRHIVSFFDMEPDYAASMFGFVCTVKQEIDRRYKPDGYNIGVNDGRAAGRSTDHLHVHIIPRYVGDVENPLGGVRRILCKDIPPEPVPDGFD